MNISGSSLVRRCSFFCVVRAKKLYFYMMQFGLRRIPAHAFYTVQASPSGLTVSQSLAVYVAAQAERSVGKYGYSPIGAVVGATYPEEAGRLRELMPKSLLLVPGYGAQGGSAEDILPCFCPDGLGAVVNSSRGILYTHMTDAERETCTREAYLNSVHRATLTMRDELYAVLKENCTKMIY